MAKNGFPDRAAGELFKYGCAVQYEWFGDRAQTIGVSFGGDETKCLASRGGWKKEKVVDTDGKSVKTRMVAA